MIDYYKEKNEIKAKIERENHKQRLLKEQENLRNKLNEIK